MQVLVVDDEYHCVEGVLYAIDWKFIGVSRVFPAYSMAQAQEIMEKEEIHIVISDVEMPKGSGFDLLAWIRGNGYEPVIIMLTSYATFKYAKQAIEFRCLDYLLKPISPEALMNVAKRAVAEVEKARQNSENDLLARYWNDNEKHRFRHFWREIVEQYPYMDSESIMKRARSEHIVFEIGNLYLPVLYKIHRNEEGTRIFFDADNIKTLLQEIFEDDSRTVLVYGRDTALAIVGAPGQAKSRVQGIADKSRQLINQYLSDQSVHMSVYMGEFKEPGAVALQYEQLQNMDKNNVAQRGGIYMLGQRDDIVDYERPNMELWMESFSAGKYAKTVEQVEKYLNRLVHERRINQDVLTKFTQDFLQAFYIAVDDKEIQAHLLFSDEVSIRLCREADSSVNSLKRWINHMINKAAGYVDMASDTDSMIRFIKKHIKENLGEELTRAQLSAVVCMSPDYLSRVFKQETGLHLSEYIKEQRMQTARLLLESTDMPVGEVGYAVGYYNFAYFSQAFRIRTGMTPAEYRSKARYENHQ